MLRYASSAGAGGGGNGTVRRRPFHAAPVRLIKYASMRKLVLDDDTLERYARAERELKRQRGPKLPRTVRSVEDAIMQFDPQRGKPREADAQGKLPFKRPRLGPFWFDELELTRFEDTLLKARKLEEQIELKKLPHHVDYRPGQAFFGTEFRKRSKHEQIADLHENPPMPPEAWLYVQRDDLQPLWLRQPDPFAMQQRLDDIKFINYFHYKVHLNNFLETEDMHTLKQTRLWRFMHGARWWYEGRKHRRYQARLLLSNKLGRLLVPNVLRALTERRGHVTTTPHPRWWEDTVAQPPGSQQPPPKWISLPKPIFGLNKYLRLFPSLRNMVPMAEGFEHNLEGFRPGGEIAVLQVQRESMLAREKAYKAKQGPRHGDGSIIEDVRPYNPLRKPPLRPIDYGVFKPLAPALDAIRRVKQTLLPPKGPMRWVDVEREFEVEMQRWWPNFDFERFNWDCQANILPNFFEMLLRQDKEMLSLCTTQRCFEKSLKPYLLINSLNLTRGRIVHIGIPNVTHYRMMPGHSLTAHEFRHRRDPAPDSPEAKEIEELIKASYAQRPKIHRSDDAPEMPSVKWGREEDGPKRKENEGLDMERFYKWLSTLEVRWDMDDPFVEDYVPLVSVSASVIFDYAQTPKSQPEIQRIRDEMTEKIEKVNARMLEIEPGIDRTRLFPTDMIPFVKPEFMMERRVGWIALVLTKSRNGNWAVQDFVFQRHYISETEAARVEIHPYVKRLCDEQNQRPPTDDLPT